jgi:hypothetical protein
VESFYAYLHVKVIQLQRMHRSEADQQKTTLSGRVWDRPYCVQFDGEGRTHIAPLTRRIGSESMRRAPRGAGRPPLVIPGHPGRRMSSAARREVSDLLFATTLPADMPTAPKG